MTRRLTPKPLRKSELLQGDGFLNNSTSNNNFINTIVFSSSPRYSFRSALRFSSSLLLPVQACEGITLTTEEQI